MALPEGVPVRRGGAPDLLHGMGLCLPRPAVRRELERDPLGERRQRGAHVAAPAALDVSSKHESGEGERVGVGWVTTVALVGKDEYRVAMEQR